jgi:hypothetical protein
VIYKNIDGYPTMWKASKASFLQRLIRKLYIAYVGQTYIPPEVTITVVRETQLSSPRYGEIVNLTFESKKHERIYIFNQFGNKIIETKI